MTDTVEFPAWIFRDRRIKPNHIRVLAARQMLGGEPSALDIARETGIDRSDVYRALHDLAAFSLIGEIPLSEQSGNAAETKAAPALGENPPSGKIPPAVPIPPVSPPKTPTPPKTPPLSPQPPADGEGARGCVLPRDWTLPDEWRAYAERIGLRAIDRVAEDFADYWHARAGPDGRKRDWFATWRTWCRRERDRQGRNGRTGQTSKPSADELRDQRRKATLAAALASGLVPARAGSG